MYLSPVSKVNWSDGFSSFSDVVKFAMLMMHLWTTLALLSTSLRDLLLKTSGNLWYILDATPLCSLAPRGESWPSIPSCSFRIAWNSAYSCLPFSLRRPSFIAFSKPSVPAERYLVVV